MKISQLEIPGVWILESTIHTDDRGTFSEWHKAGEIKKFTNEDFVPTQANVSTSKIGVLRGIHFSLAKVGQAKLVTCVHGEIQDVVVDLRKGSPTFGKYISQLLSPNRGTSLLISKGLGHGFLSLEDGSKTVYLVSSDYSPTEEFVLNPLDASVNIDWKIPALDCNLSDKDRYAPNLDELLNSEKLPYY
jgi:dTDP-4-dehydrorhamnose 3,5-epimerase